MVKSMLAGVISQPLAGKFVPGVKLTVTVSSSSATSSFLMGIPSITWLDPASIIVSSDVMSTLPAPAVISHLIGKPSAGAGWDETTRKSAKG